MRLVRVLGLFLGLLASATGVGCGKKGHDSHKADQAAAAANPTPDTTPIAALRTPAGWLLMKAEPTAPPATATPAPKP